MSKPLIVAEELTKILCKDLKRSLWYGTTGVARELLGRPRQGLALRTGEFRALDRVSFEVQEGESLGLVGRNGAGKTTLLRVLSGLFTPDAGRVTVRGRVGALIALGAGFNPLLSGRENIFVNAAVLGFDRAQTQARFDAIVDFAEVADFIDAPLHTYSSGMQARLGFAVAAQLEPDILLVDEVLAVGDIAFRTKCYRRINQLMANGTAVILVSHQASMLLSVCKTGLLLESGQSIARGPIEQVVRVYEERLADSQDTRAENTLHAHSPAVSSDDFVIDGVEMLGPDGMVIPALETGAAGSFNIRCKARSAMDGIRVLVLIRGVGEEGAPLLALDTASNDEPLKLASGVSDIRFQMPSVGLAPGRYRAKLTIVRDNLDMLAAIEAFPFRVQSGRQLSSGQFFQDGRWQSISRDA